MKLSQLAAKPTLVKVTLDAEDIVKKFGEPIDFWTWDRQPLTTFMEMSRMSDSGEQNYAELFELVRELILDEDGKPIVNDEQTLPTSVLLAAIMAVVSKLGN